MFIKLKKKSLFYFICAQDNSLVNKLNSFKFFQLTKNYLDLADLPLGEVAKFLFGYRSANKLPRCKHTRYLVEESFFNENLRFSNFPLNARQASGN